MIKQHITSPKWAYVTYNKGKYTEDDYHQIDNYYIDGGFVNLMYKGEIKYIYTIHNLIRIEIREE